MLAAAARAQPCRSQTASEMKPALTECLTPQRTGKTKKNCQKLSILDQIAPELRKPTHGCSSCPGSQELLPLPGCVLPNQMGMGK